MNVLNSRLARAIGMAAVFAASVGSAAAGASSASSSAYATYSCQVLQVEAHRISALSAAGMDVKGDMEALKKAGVQKRCGLRL